MKSKMKFENVSLHQGDVQMFKLAELPSGLNKVEKQYIAASERSGSFHALFGSYDIYEVDGGGFVIDAHEECVLNHSLQSELNGVATMDKAVVIPKKDHRHTIVPPGKYYVDIQTRFDPLENTKKRVID